MLPWRQLEDGMKLKLMSAPLLAFTMLLAAAGSVAAAPATTFTQVTIFTLPPFVFDDPCFGEPVLISGDIHDLFHVTLTGNGTGHIQIEDNPQGVTGIGTVTGKKWQGTGVTRDDANFSAVPFNETFVNNFRIIGPGPNNNFVIHDNIHITVNANGTVTSFHDNTFASCQ
jgi:hypothetical protein